MSTHGASVHVSEGALSSPWPQQKHASDSLLARTIDKVNIGSLGPSGGARQHLRYYDSLFYTALHFGAHAKTSIEVGCASDPFLQHLGWIEKRTCVAPYFVKYDQHSGGHDNTKLKKNGNAIERVTADFMEYTLPDDHKFDLLICSQVLEHVPDPSSFMKKLIRSAKTSIVSVPFQWGDCGKKCNHVTDNISRDVLLKWSKPYVPIYQGIVSERDGRHVFDKRIILVFLNNDIDDDEYDDSEESADA